jgi:hypothetical protein
LSALQSIPGSDNDKLNWCVQSLNVNCGSSGFLPPQGSIGSLGGPLTLNNATDFAQTYYAPSSITAPDGSVQGHFCVQESLNPNNFVCASTYLIPLTIDLVPAGNTAILPEDFQKYTATIYASAGLNPANELASNMSNITWLPWNVTGLQPVLEEGCGPEEPFFSPDDFTENYYYYCAPNSTGSAQISANASVVLPAGSTVTISSTPATVTVKSGLLSQSVNFGAIPGQSAPSTLPLTATASSGLPVIFSSTTPSVCMVNGSTATLYIGGICSITAEQTGNTTYQAASTTQNFTVTGIASVPAISPAGGTYNNPPSITLTDSTPGSTIHYTLNGTTPTASSPVYSAPISVGENFTLNAVAIAPYYNLSSVTTASYNLAAATPVISPAGGSYSSPQTVTISTASTGASIFYTVNGATPTGNNQVTPVYTGPITVSSSETVKAIAVQTGYTQSPVASQAYTITGPLPTPAPTISPSGGAYNNPPTITLSDTASGATIYYTRNGTTPTTSSNVYTASFVLSQNTTINAVALAPGDTLSSVSTASYTLVDATPVVGLGAGTYTGPQTVTITTASTGAGLWYTTNGQTPMANPSVSTLYTGPITISASKTLKVIAVQTGYTKSPIVTEVYTIQ